MVNNSITCPECSRVFIHHGKCGEKNCPSAAGCFHVKCPDCGHEFRPISPWVGGIISFFQNLKSSGGTSQ